MTEELRKSGISIVGDLPWGTHFCTFYETKQDLLDILVPYFKAGLESKEFCLWIVSNSELITTEEAKEALGQAVFDLDRYLAEGRIEVVSHDQWFLKNGAFDFHRVAYGFKEKLDEALANGYAGLRINGSPAWIQAEDANVLREFEGEADHFFADEHIIASCTYPLGDSRTEFLLDVARNHQFTIARRHGKWDVLETPELIQAKAEIRKLNEELEQRVIERTNELVAANEALKNEITQRRRIDEELRERAADLTEAQRVAKIGNWIFDLRTNKVNWSEQLYRIFEIEERDFDGRYESFVSRIHPDDRPRVLRTSAQAKIEGLPFDIEYHIIAPNDEVKIIREVGYAAKDEAGNVIRLFGTAQDITERKQAEEALAERLRFETLLTELSAAFASLTSNEVDHEIDKWLRNLVESLGVDRASFFQFREDWRTLYRSHSYTVPGIEPLPPPPMGMTEQFPWITDQLRRGITVKWSRIPDDMPEEAVKEKEYAASRGVKSGLNIPVRMGGSVICAITFTSMVAYRDWPDAMIARLRLVGEIFAAAVERKRAEEKLKQSERQLAEAQRLAQIGSWDWDLRTNVVTWSDELYHIFGLEPGTISVAGEVDRFIHPDDLALGWDTVKRAIASKEPYDYYHRILRPDGTERIAHSHGAVVTDDHGEPIKVFGATQDVTELKRAEENLKATSEQLRALSASLQSAREQESTRIAREIHDELGGTLTSLRWDLEEVRDVISEASTSSQLAALRSKIEVMITLTDTILDTVRRLASELRPMALDELGLVEAIEWQALQFETRTGIAVEYECHLEKVDLNSEQSTAVFRILQEALTNVLRHAQATEVTVTLKQESGEFFLAIKDNGRGITENEKSDAHSLGLLGMRERAHLIGAQIDITGIAGKGTLVTMRIPISESSEHQKKSKS